MDGTKRDRRSAIRRRATSLLVLVAVLGQTLVVAASAAEAAEAPGTLASFSDTVDVPGNRVYRSFDVDVTADDLDGAATGTVTAALTWEGSADLDLFVRPKGSTGAFAASSTTSVNPEQLSFTAGPGTYTFTVKGVSGATAFDLTTGLETGASRTFLGTSQAGGQSWRAYELPVTAPGLVTATLDWEGAANLELYLRDPSGAVVRTSKTTNVPEAVAFEAATTGTYEVVVSSTSGAAAFAAEATVTTDPTDRTYRSVVGHAGKLYDSFDVTVPAAGTLAASLGWEGTADLDLFVRPIAVDGSVGALTTSSVTSQNPEQLTIDAPAGTYRLTVHAKSGGTDFTLTTSHTTGAVRTYLGTSELAGQRYRTYSFPVTEPGLLAADLSWEGSADLSLFLRDPNGTQLQVSRTTLQPERLSHLVSTPGTYTLLVGSESGGAPFTLQAALQTDPTDRRYTGTVGQGGQSQVTHDVVVGAGDLGDDGTATLNAVLGWEGNADLDLLVRRVQSNNAVVASSVTGVNPEQVSVDVTEPGTYRLVVAATSGAASFTLDTALQTGEDRVLLGTSQMTGQRYRSYPIRTTGAGTIDVALDWDGGAQMQVELLEGNTRLAISSGTARPRTVSAEVPAAGTYTVKAWVTSGAAAFAAQVDVTTDEEPEPENTPPTIEPIDDQTATEGEPFGPLTVEASDADDDGLTLSAAGLPDGLELDGDEISGTPEEGTAADSPYTVTVTADDGTDDAEVSFELTVEPAPVAADPCPLVSIEPCTTVPVDLPYVIDWTADDLVGLGDADGAPTGFTAVDPPSAPLGLAVDGTSTTPTFVDAPGYEPSRLTVDPDAGTLTIDATKGIMYREPTGSANTNSQLNALAVGVDAADEVLEISTTVEAIAFPSVNGSQQAGVWFGLDEDDHVKLVYANSTNGLAKVQLVREIGGTAQPASIYELNSPNFPKTEDVTLTLRVDGVTDTVSGTYQLGDGPVVELVDAANTVSSTALPIPPSFTAGAVLSDDETGPVSFAGLFASSRNATTAAQLIDATFTGFAIDVDEESEPEPEPDAPCPLVSPEACTTVPVELPYELDWSQAQSGLGDAEGAGTGFTMVDPPSSRLPESFDPASSVEPTFPDAPGYEPDRLAVDAAGGTFTIASTRGIQYRTNTTGSTGSTNTNSLLNAVGVGVDAGDGPLRIRTSLDGIDFPNTTTNASQQAGLWFGLDEDDYVKLIVQDQAGANANVQLAVERGGILDPNAGAGDALTSASFTDDQDVDLELLVDPDAGTVAARYRLEGGAWTDLAEGATLAIPGRFTDGVTLSDDATGPVSFAGVFATSRNTTVLADYLDATFSTFVVEQDVDEEEPFTPFDAQVNFQSETAPVPSGYLRDFGQPFGARTSADQGEGLSYGWVDPVSGDPLSLVNNGRDRNRAGIPQELDTLIHMQFGDVANATPPNVLATGAWEIAVPNGVYEVTVSVGDQGSAANGYDSVHAINVERGIGIEAFQATSSQEYEQATVVAAVEDGRLRLDPIGGTNTKLNYVHVERIPAVPVVTNVLPDNRSTNAAIDGGVSTSIAVPGAAIGVEPTSLEGNVHLYEVATGELVPTTVGTSGGNDVISLDPNDALEEETAYRFVVTDGVTSEDDVPFAPFTSVFTTRAFDGGPQEPADEFEPLTGIAFEQVEQTVGRGKYIASMTFGPDGKLYASTIGQGLFRYDVADDGTLSNEQVLGMQGRAVVGLVFDEDATADDLGLWITHTSANVDNEASLWNSKVSYLSGANLGTVTDVFVGLPRSLKDHLTNSMVYGPGGDLYFLQGSNQAAGDLDSSWGTRGEQLLTAALLRFDPDHAAVQAALAGGPAIDVQTAGGASYDPYADGAPLTIHATGIRNAYDLTYHSNGHLYVPTNGTAGGANTPGVVANANGTFTQTSAANAPYNAHNGRDVTEACTERRPDGEPYTGPNVPAVANHPTQRDFLFRIDEGGYYGHPNPLRCEWVLSGGSTGDAFGQGGSKYGPNVAPDPNFRGYAYDFEFNKSPNGVIEYQSETFGGQLKNRLVVVRFSNNNDLIFLQPDSATGEILGAQTQLGIPDVPNTTMSGVGGFHDPLEIIEDPTNGNLYVNQYDRGGNRQTLYLLRVPEDQQAPTPGLRADVDELVFSAASRNAANVIFNDPTNTPQTVTVTNTSDEPITLDTTVAGTHAARFLVTGDGTTITPGGSVDVGVVFVPQDGLNGVLRGTITIVGGSDELTVELYALAHPKQEGGGEPPLVQVFQALGFAVNPGWTSLADGVQPIAKGDEVLEPLFERVGTGPVSMTPIAAYAPQEILPFGWYTSADGGGPAELHEVGALANGQLQTLYPKLARGGSTFDPGDASFGFYYDSTTFGRVGYTEDARNDSGGMHRARIYPAADRQGRAIANAYIVAFEDASNGDYNDYVFLVRGIRPAGSGQEPPPPSSDAIRINFQNAAAAVPEDYLRDFGQPFGPRSSADQGEGLSYGWLDQATENPIDLSTGGTTPGNGRERNLVSDQRFDTLMHMQAGDLVPPSKPGGTFNGVGAYAFWELALPDGTYEVTVAVGDPSVGSDPESHTINVENQPLITGFAPSGVAGAATRSTTATTVVDVTDGRLSLDAAGGTNTKIHYVDVTPLDGQALTRQISFRPSAPAPAGWEADTGLGYTDARGYGWVTLGTTTPVDRSNATRARTAPAGQPLLQTFNIMQNNAVAALTNGAWRMALPNGVYTVEVSVGDAAYFDSVHSIEANGVDVISEYVPSGLGDFESGSALVEVDDGFLTVQPGFGGNNTKINWIRVTGEPCEGDCFPPSVSITADGPRDFATGDFANEATVTISATDLGGSGVDSITYTVDGGSEQDYDDPFTLEGAGEYEIVATATDGAGNEGTETATIVVLDVDPVDARIATANMDATRQGDAPIPGFWDDWLTMHRINAGVTNHQVHDEATLEIRNTGSDDDLIVGDLEVSNAQFTVVDAPDLPFTVAPGEAEPITVKFVASGTPNKSVRQAQLTVVSNDPFQRDTVVELRGLYMSAPEGNNENTATQIAQAFGYGTDLGEPLTEQNSSPLAGDEVRSAFWERQNPNQPVVVRQLVALHGCCTSADRFEFRSVAGGNVGGFNHDPLYGQTILPPKVANQGGGPGELIWNTSATNQPFQITAANYTTNTTGNLGIRTWPVVDRHGDVVPDAWFVIQDFVQNGCGSGSANCDYQDNIYLITNIVPQGQRDTTPPPVPTGLEAELDDGAVTVTWGAVDAADLAGYDVQRATSTSGPWTKLNGGLLTSTSFTDTAPPTAPAVHYRVVAEDRVGNRSAPSSSVAVATTTEPEEPPVDDEVIRINAGGPEVTTGGVTWSADQHFSGGKSYTNGAVTAIAGTDDDVLYLTERSATSNLGSFAYDIPVEDGTYEVRLHLAEIYWGATNGGAGGTGQRVFSVAAEGEPFLTNYDLNAEVAPMTAVVETTEVSVTDGVLDLDFTASVNQPKVSAIEVERVGGAVGAGPDTVRINTGGPSQTVAGTVWSGCTAVNACNGWVSGGFAYSQATPISGVPAGMNATIFQSEWTGGQAGPAGTIVPIGQRAFGFDVPVGNGGYLVRLHFAELNKPQPGTRVFDVELEGELVLDGLDLTAEDGLGTATVREFPIVVTDGVVTIDFIRQIENAKISAIEIVPHAP